MTNPTEPDPPLDPVPDDVTDPEVAEDFAESVPVDPTPEQIDQYLELAGEQPLTGTDDDAVVEPPAERPEDVR